MNTAVKLELELARMTGDFIGTLTGILSWDIPIELKELLENKLNKLNEQIQERG